MDRQNVGHLTKEQLAMLTTSEEVPPDCEVALSPSRAFGELFMEDLDFATGAATTDLPLSRTSSRGNWSGKH